MLVSFAEVGKARTKMASDSVYVFPLLTCILELGEFSIQQKEPAARPIYYYYYHYYYFTITTTTNRHSYQFCIFVSLLITCLWFESPRFWQHLHIHQDLTTLHDAIYSDIIHMRWYYQICNTAKCQWKKKIDFAESHHTFCVAVLNGPWFRLQKLAFL